MAPLQDYSSLRKVLVLYLALVFFTSSILISANTVEVEPQKYEFFGRRTLLEVENEDKPIKKKASTTTTTAPLFTKNQTKLANTTNGLSKNQTKLIKTITSSSKNHTKIIKLPSETLKNKIKLIKPTSDSSTNEKPTIKSQLKKLNFTSKSSTSAKNSTLLTKKSSDLTSKSSSAKNKTAKATTTKETKILLDKDLSSESKSNSNTNSKSKPKSTAKDQSSDKKLKSEKAHQQTLPSWIDQEEDDEDDLGSGFRDLPSKFQETLLPDLERISKTSKVYLNKANKEITRGFKPIVGNKYASTIASIVSFAFILIPLLLVSLIFNRIKAYFSLQKVLIFIQVYLSIYFSILCLSSLATGLEPLKFFYVTSWSTYVCLQVLQTLAYVLYLLLLLMYLILVFSTETGLVTKLLGLGQTFVGFAVGLHYYMTVFHRAVLRQPPKTSWRVHGIYATCYLVICLLTRADRRKKAYVGGEEGKMS